MRSALRLRKRRIPNCAISCEKFNNMSFAKCSNASVRTRDVMTADQLIALLHGVRAAGKDRWRALCPAHEDRTPSLSIVQKPDKLLIYCFSGCRAIDIVNALGITLAD